MDKLLSNILIPPASKAEAEYFQKYKIQFKKLENGATILGIPCNKDYTCFSHIKFEFSDGAFGNKPGTVHFLEHFFNKKLHEIADKNSLSINAFTSQIEVCEDISGVTNPQNKDYGIWKILTGIRKALESPLSVVSDIEKQIKSEKEVIKTELKHRRGNHDILVSDHTRNVIYSPLNPLHDIPPVIGEEEDINNISLNDLKTVTEKVLIPQNLLINYYSEGTLEISEALSAELTKLFSSFPREDKLKNTIDEDSLGLINKDLIRGKEYLFDTKLKNSLVTTEYFWILENKLPEVSYFALKTLRNIVDTELFLESRKKGWGYRTNAYLSRPNDKVGVFSLRIDSRKDSSKNYLPEIKSILKSVPKTSEEICKSEILRQKAVPMSTIDRFSWVVSGIKDYNAMIDADKIRSIMLEVNANAVNKLSEQLLNTEPIVLITGDLN